MLFYLGLLLILIGVFIIVYSLFYAHKNHIRNEMKEYRELANSSNDYDDYEPPTPIERMYEKKPINSFINDDEETVSMLDDDEIDKIVGFSESEEETDLLDESGFETATEYEPDGFENETDLLNDIDEESTTILESDEEATSLLSENDNEEETTLLGDEEETTFLNDEEATSFLEDIDFLAAQTPSRIY